MTENDKKPGFQFNVGKIEAWPNGGFINIGMHLRNPNSNLKEGDSLTYHCGKLNEDYDVDFEYADLSPAEARQLAKELLMYAKEIEADFKSDWVVLCEGKI